MDPLSILSLVEACAGLSVTASKLAIGLKSLADSYRQSAMTFKSLSCQCKLFAISVRAIQAWMEDPPELSTIDDRIWEQLADSLECANDAIYALEGELVNTSGTSVNTFWNKANVVWNLQNMKDLEDCIYKQICSLGVILQIMNLPTPQSRSYGLQEEFSVFQASRDSTMSLRDTETSTLKGGADFDGSIRAPSTIMTSLSQLPQFDFDEMLLTSQVYLRNRNKTLAMNTRMTSVQNRRDAGTLVSGWDLPPRSANARELDLPTLIQYLNDGNIENVKNYIETNFIHQYEEVQARYSKIKRWYYDQCIHVERLQEELEVFKSIDSNATTFVEREMQQAALARANLAGVKESAQSGREIQRLAKPTISTGDELERYQEESARAALADVRELVKFRERKIEKLEKQIADYQLLMQKVASAQAVFAAVKELAESRGREIERLQKLMARDVIVEAQIMPDINGGRPSTK
jgi:hypothetical protein